MNIWLNNQDYRLVKFTDKISQILKLEIQTFGYIQKKMKIWNLELS